MPRRRRDQGEPSKRRARTGCLTCRRRKIKCDESKPTCRQCREKCLDCEVFTTLKWEEDYLSRGLAFGRAGNVKNPAVSSPLVHEFDALEAQHWKLASRIHSYTWVNLTLDRESQLVVLSTPIRSTSFDVDDDFEHGSSASLSRNTSVSPRLRQQDFLAIEAHLSSFPSSMPQFTTNGERELLSYFLHHICPLTVPATARSSPLASLIIPYAVSKSPIVLTALLSLSSCHRGRSECSDDKSTTALLLCNRTITHLQTRIAVESPLQIAGDTEILLLMMILCLFEIVRQSDKNWVCHLRAARALIRSRRSWSDCISSNSAEYELVEFSQKFFAFHDVIGRTACGEEPVFGSDFWVVDNPVCDPWLGCSPKLVGTICGITELSRLHSTNPAIEADFTFQARAAALEAELERLEQLSEDPSLLRSADLKQVCSEVYLHCALYGATPQTALVKDRVLATLQLVSTQLLAGVRAGLIWPVFMAAVEMDPWDEPCFEHEGHFVYGRPFILLALDLLGNAVANVRRARTVIEEVWQARDEDATVIGPDSRNDWERHIAPLCGNMSLA